MQVSFFAFHISNLKISEFNIFDDKEIKYIFHFQFLSVLKKHIFLLFYFHLFTNLRTFVADKNINRNRRMLIA